MLFFLITWVLCFTSAQTLALPKGSWPGGDRQGDGRSLAPALRKMLQNAQPLIAGGQDAPEGRFPYACSLRTIGPRIHLCGGTLIAPQWVLTAAHCLIGEDSLGPTPLVYVGAHRMDDESFAEVILAVEVIVHESYTGNVEDGFDIALVRLQEPSTKRPVVLAQSEQSIGVGQLLATAGWGKTSKRGPLPDVLQFADEVEYVSNINCQQRWSKIKDSMLCAFSTSQGACKGDSGGPLLIPDSKGGLSIVAGDPKFDLQVGIVSYGPEGCDSTKADVYTRVSSFRKWIDSKMNTEQKRKCTENCEELDKDLFDAAGSGKPNKVKELLAKGADVTSTHQQKFTPLHFAAAKGHVDIVEILIEAGAPVDMKTVDGSTALVLAAYHGKMEVVDALLKSGANVNSRTNAGLTPLMLSTYIGRAKVVQLILDYKAEKDAQDNKGSTALKFAAFYGSGGAMEVLIGAGADPDIEGNDQEKAVDVICKCLQAKSTDLQCGEGKCGKGEAQYLKALLKG